MLKQKTPSPRQGKRPSLHDKEAPATRTVLNQIRQERLKKFEKVNEKLEIELKELRRTHVPLAAITSAVLSANSKVRQRLESLPHSLALQVSGSTAAEAETLMRSAIRTALEELATEEKLAATAEKKRR